MRKQDNKLARDVPHVGVEPATSELSALSLNAEMLVASDNPVALVNGAGDVVAANTAGRNLIWAVLSRAEEAERLMGLVAQSRRAGTVATGRVTLRHVSDGNDDGDFQDVEIEVTPLEPNSRTYDLFVLPTGNEQAEAILLAREVTFEQNLTRALTSSRGLFKDLVSCSADFSWEVDRAGSFTYVGPLGALGYSSAELNGASLSIFVTNETERQSAEDLFLSDHEVRERSICLISKDGTPHHFSMASKPIYDENGRHAGNRGVGRDVTELHNQRVALESAQRHQDALNAVLTATTSSLDPQVILEGALRAVVSSVSAQMGVLFIVDPENQNGATAQFSEETICVWDAQRRPEETHHTEDMSDLIASLRPFAGRSLSKAQERSELMVDNWSHLLCLTTFQDKANGVICVSRPMSADAWTEDDRRIFSDVTKTLGIAIGQASQTRQLTKLSRQDPLTNLLNRRSFEEEVTRRLHQHRRHNRPSALMYIDLDDFKQINDTYGHQTGDRVLCSVASVLERNLRAGDIAVRFGGDEFAIWLEEADTQGAEAKARQILSLIGQVQKTLGLALPTSASIGVAPMCSGAATQWEELTAQADKALYEAKAAGKGAFVFAESPVIETEREES